MLSDIGKAMDNHDYVIDKIAGVAFSSSSLARDWYQKQYHRLLEENKMLEEECKALREQVNALSN